MKLKNANIKSKEEALHRMIDGEVFYYNGCKIYYTKELLDNLKSFFITMSIDGSLVELQFILDQYYFFEVEVNWEDDLNDKDILCHVWDSEVSKKLKITAWVARKEEESYITTNNKIWYYATPITIEDLWNKGE